MRAKDITTPPSTGIAPPERPVPAPRGTIGTPCSWQKRATAATSAVVSGSTTASGEAVSADPSYSYVSMPRADRRGGGQDAAPA